MKTVHFLLTLLFCYTNVHAQQTVGLFSIDNDAFDGYNLFAPMSSTTTYLIDNCGREVHTWNSSYRPGLSVYLLEDGRLLRTGDARSTVFTAGGGGGIVEILDWNGNQVWEYQHSSAAYCHHHDVEYLPNGNVLLVAWELVDSATAVAAGRDPSMVTTANGLWPDKIIEVQPTGSNTGTIVWEWHAWDHMIQDFDNSKANFGVVADHPELINLNYPVIRGGGRDGGADWLHTNSVDYNAEFDQLLLSVRSTNEIWVIDHSTTTAEAAGHTGGRSGKGGDLLYRWGNPEAYDRGGANDQKLFLQHDAHWIEDSLPWAGKIMIFSNGLTNSNSTVEVITPPVSSQGVYSITGNQAFGPANPYWTYHGGSNTWYSMNISGAHALPNGNTLITDGPAGRFFEVDSMGNTHWEYVNPIGQNGAPVTQGSQPAQNDVFRVHRYEPGYPGLSGQTLIPGDRLEVNPLSLPALCTNTAVPMGATAYLGVYPNPFDDRLIFRIEGYQEIKMAVFDMLGQQITFKEKVTDGDYIDARRWPPGVYWVRFYDKGLETVKVVKR